MLIADAYNKCLRHWQSFRRVDPPLCGMAERGNKPPQMQGLGLEPRPELNRDADCSLERPSSKSPGTD